MRPIDVGGSNIRLHHAGHSSRKGRNSCPIDIGLVDVGGRDLGFGNLRNVCRQPLNLRPINVGVNDIRHGDLCRGDHGNGGVQFVRRNRARRQLLDLGRDGIQSIDIQDIDQGFGNVCPRNAGILNVGGANGRVLDLQTAHRAGLQLSAGLVLLRHQIDAGSHGRWHRRTKDAALRKQRPLAALVDVMHQRKFPFAVQGFGHGAAHGRDHAEAVIGKVGAVGRIYTDHARYLQFG